MRLGWFGVPLFLVAVGCNGTSPTRTAERTGSTPAEILAALDDPPEGGDPVTVTLNPKKPNFLPALDGPLASMSDTGRRYSSLRNAWTRGAP